MKGAHAAVLSGATAAEGIYTALRERVTALGRRAVTPGLAAVRVGDDPASRVYVRNKIRACERVGIRSEVHALPNDCSQEHVLACIDRLNENPAVHGILLQLPLPGHLVADCIMQRIAPGKDVDGLTRHSLGALLAGNPVFEPCTPAGVMVLLARSGTTVDRSRAVVVGRSAIVGKPMALMLLARGATVTVCHSRTPRLEEETRRADILVSATGRAGLITVDMVKTGAVVVDVGITRLEDGRLAGDVDFPSVSQVAGAITPVPGGVGPMTVAMLISNTVAAAERASVA